MKNSFVTSAVGDGVGASVVLRFSPIWGYIDEILIRLEGGRQYVGSSGKPLVKQKVRIVWTLDGATDTYLATATFVLSSSISWLLLEYTTLLWMERKIALIKGNI